MDKVNVREEPIDGASLGRISGDRWFFNFCDVICADFVINCSPPKTGTEFRNDALD